MNKFDEIFDDAVSMLPRPARFGVVITWLLLTIVIVKQFVVSFLLAFDEWSFFNAVVALTMAMLLVGLIIFAVYWYSYWREKFEDRNDSQNLELLKFD